MTTDIKIKEELWNLIVSGEKTTEFRKLIKGYTKGTYRFVSVEKYKQYLTSYKDIPGHKTKDGRIIFGLATLTPEYVNPTLWKSKNDYWYTINEYCFECYIEQYKLDKLSYDFVTKHYVGKHDFILYDITDVKDLR